MQVRQRRRPGVIALLWSLLLPTHLLAAPPPLKILTWSEYMSPELVAEFETRFDAHVEFTYFESDSERDEKLAIRGGNGYDLILVNSLQMEQYVKRRWLAPVSEADVPNQRLIDSRWKTAHPGADGFGVPYFWGTMGIGYRSDLYPDGFASWRDLLEPAPALRGKLLMPDFTREAMGIAMKTLGHSVNTVDRQLIHEGAELLMAQKPAVRYYRYPSLSDDSVFVSGDIIAGMMYAGDVLTLQEFAPGMRFVIPEEGGLLWLDFLAVAHSSANKPLAYALLNFLNEPDIAARQARFVHYPSPNTAAAKLLPAEFLANPDIYPPKDVLDRSELIRSLPPRSQKLINSISVQLKSGR